jgi:hypothetical protein
MGPVLRVGCLTRELTATLAEDASGSPPGSRIVVTLTGNATSGDLVHVEEQLTLLRSRPISVNVERLGNGRSLPDGSVETPDAC